MNEQDLGQALDLEIEVLEPLDAHVAAADGPGAKAWQAGWDGVGHAAQAVYNGTQGNWGAAAQHGASAIRDFGTAGYNGYQYINGGH